VDLFFLIYVICYRLYALTLGFCGIGVMVDVFRMPQLVVPILKSTLFT
jgi:hypothetical protein